MDSAYWDDVYVIKRDKSKQRFDAWKIRRALLSAFHASEEVNISEVSEIVEDVKIALIPLGKEININEIQAAVEDQLIDYGYKDVVTEYIRYKINRDQQRKTRLKPDNVALAEYIHVAKYARYRPELGRREIYSETVDRVRMMHCKAYPHLINDISLAFDAVLKRRVLPAMRSMQFAGAAINVNHARMYNCAFSLCDRPRFFQELFWLLLSGAGCGYSVQFRHVEQLPELTYIGKIVGHHVIKDTIEGWADAIGILVDSYMVPESEAYGLDIEFSYHEIRGEGTPLKTSGGLAPGHKPLKRCLEVVRDILSKAQGRKLRTIECHDICCHIAEAVLSGGIRRSSMLALFSENDSEMMFAKIKGVFHPTGLNSQRQMANNSVILLRSQVTQQQLHRIVSLAQQNFGCPGFFFTDDLDVGPNPCGEIGLEPIFAGYRDVQTGQLSAEATERCLPVRETGWGFCDLTEINGALCRSAQDFYDACSDAAFINTLQAGFTNFKYLTTASKLIAERDALLGVGIMGIMDNPELMLNPDVLRKGAKIVKDVNKHTAALIGINPAKRCTTVKPGGTAPLEAGVVGSGISPHHARRYFRRVTANKNEECLHYFQQINPHMVEEKPNGDYCITFPIQTVDTALTLRDMPANKQLEAVFTVYENWVKPGTREGSLTHNVSSTIVVDDKEIGVVVDAIFANRDRIAATTFVSVDLDAKFPYAPREAVLDEKDEAYWNQLISNYKEVDWSAFRESGLTLENRSVTVACAGGACEI